MTSRRAGTYAGLLVCAASIFAWWLGSFIAADPEVNGGIVMRVVVWTSLGLMLLVVWDALRRAFLALSWHVPTVEDED